MFVGIERFIGSGQNDQFYGTAGADHFSAGEGDDLFFGRGGADVFNGGEGSDTVSFSSAVNGLSIYLTGDGTNAGAAAGDVLIAIEAVTGSGFDDHLTGNTLANAFAGGTGADEFIFTPGCGADRISDFASGIDHLVLDDALWAGESGTTAEILASHSTIDGNDLILTFLTGDTIRLEGLGSSGIAAGDVTIT